jgi:N-acetylglutamate synthase-like GNAT family acetyltransferase
MTMTEPRYVARRATVEDLPQLVALWKLEQLPAATLEKRFTEFQLVSDDTDQVIGAIGLQIAGTQGWLHSESIAKPELSDTLRELLWHRLQIIIQNHALERIWTQMNAAFWRDRGFGRATEEQLKQRPGAFPDSDLDWHVATLRAANANAALEREFAQIKNLQAQEQEKIQERIRWAKRIALGVTIVVFLLVVAWAVALLKYGPKLMQR